jgi:hypothetical protein
MACTEARSGGTISQPFSSSVPIPLVRKAHQKDIILIVAHDTRRRHRCSRPELPERVVIKDGKLFFVSQNTVSMRLVIDRCQTVRKSAVRTDGLLTRCAVYILNPMMAIIA